MRANRGLRLLGIAGLFVSATILKADTTYSYSGPRLGEFAGPTIQGVDHVSGEFTTAEPLGPNLDSVDITPLILSYFFSDGLYGWDENNSRLAGGINGGFTVTTNEVGAISYWDFSVDGTQQATLLYGERIPITVTDDIFSEGCPHNDGGIGGGGAPTNIVPTAFYPCWGDVIGESVIVPPQYVSFFFFGLGGGLSNELQNGIWSVTTPEPSVGFPLMAMSLALATVIFRGSRYAARERKMQQVTQDRFGA